jgi:hypothetical protein
MLLAGVAAAIGPELVVRAAGLVTKPAHGERLPG